MLDRSTISFFPRHNMDINYFYNRSNTYDEDRINIFVDPSIFINREDFVFVNSPSFVLKRISQKKFNIYKHMTCESLTLQFYLSL